MFFPGQRGAGMYPRRRGGGENNIFVAMMFAQLLQRIERLPYKPPITLFLMATMAALYFTPETLLPMLRQGYESMDYAFNPLLIVNSGHWHRFWLSTLMHVNAMHLYYNLSSFLYKGVALESLLGDRFAFVIVALAALSQGIFLGLSWLATEMGWMPQAWSTFTMGFSGIIFALKVLINSLDEIDSGFGFGQFFRLDLPWNKIVWVELLIAQFMVPGSSFLGHLSGIFAGIAFLPMFSALLGANNFTFFARPRFYGNGTASRNSSQPTTVPSERARESRESIGSGSAPPQRSSQQLSTEEIRRRRLERLGVNS